MAAAPVAAARTFAAPYAVTSALVFQVPEVVKIWGTFVSFKIFIIAYDLLQFFLGVYVYI